MDTETLFQCPVCAQALLRGEAQYHCRNGHTFDIARNGYVNLLMPGHTGRGEPGDTKEMLQHRRDFLNKGYYEPFSDRLNDVIADGVARAGAQDTAILDAGCGEGYYAWRLNRRLSALEHAERISLYGIDVSKPAIHLAAARDTGIRFAVASNFHLPLLPECLDYLLCIFAPRDEAEFCRVLKPSGMLIVAAPGPRHLYGFKTALYQEAEEIGTRGTVGAGFTLLNTRHVAYTMRLASNADIMSLLMMTPYVRHTDPQTLEHVKTLETLDTEVDINLLLYRKA